MNAIINIIIIISSSIIKSDSAGTLYNVDPRIPGNFRMALWGS